MDIKAATAYAQAPQLVAQYEDAKNRAAEAKRVQLDTERDLARAQRALARALIPEGSCDGQSYRVWVPHGLLELTARPLLDEKCTVEWLVKDDSREAQRAAVPTP